MRKVDLIAKYYHINYFQKAHNTVKIHHRLMHIGIHTLLVMVSKCMKFESNSFDTSTRKVDLNAKFNQIS